MDDPTTRTTFDQLSATHRGVGVEFFSTPMPQEQLSALHHRDQGRCRLCRLRVPHPMARRQRNGMYALHVDQSSRGPEAYVSACSLCVAAVDQLTGSNREVRARLLQALIPGDSAEARTDLTPEQRAHLQMVRAAGGADPGQWDEDPMPTPPKPKPGSLAVIPSPGDMRGLWIQFPDDADPREHEEWLAVQGAKRVGNAVVLPPRRASAEQPSRSPQLQVLEQIQADLRGLRNDLTGSCRDDDHVDGDSCPSCGGTARGERRDDDGSQS